MAVSLLKLRIGVAIAASALAGMAAASGPGLCLVAGRCGLTLAVLGASGAAGAFNHYYERDLDRLMRRTRSRVPSPAARSAKARGGRSALPSLLAVSLGACRGSRRYVAAALRVPRRLHLRHRLHGLAEAAQHVEHRRRRACRQFRGAGRSARPSIRRRRWCPSCWQSCCSCGRRRISGALRPRKGEDYARGRRSDAPGRGPGAAPGRSRSCAHRSALAADLAGAALVRQGRALRARRRRPAAASSCGRASSCIAIRPSRTRWRISLPRCCSSACWSRRAARQRWSDIVMARRLMPQRAAVAARRLVGRRPPCRAARCASALDPACRDRRQAKPRWGAPSATIAWSTSTGAPLSLRITAAVRWSSASSIHVLQLGLSDHDAASHRCRRRGAHACSVPDAFAVLTVGFDARNDTPARMAHSPRCRASSSTTGASPAPMPRRCRHCCDDLGFSYARRRRRLRPHRPDDHHRPDGRIYRHVYGDDFPVQMFIEPLKDAGLRDHHDAFTLRGLVDRIKFICTAYDPGAGRYRIDYGLVFGSVHRRLVAARRWAGSSSNAIARRRHERRAR